MSAYVPIVAAVLAFLAGLAVALLLARTGRERTAFAAVVASPLLAATAFAAVTSMPHRTNPDTAGAAPAATAATASPAGVPTEADGLRRTAEELRLARRFNEARDAYQKLVKASPNDVDAWADLADAQAAASNGDLRSARASIERARAIDPKHPKALWLKASLELEDQHYAEAGQLWERLLSQLPPDSNDARIVRANLDEARALAAKQGAGR